jgi:uncharacterized repeat protein (TIGR02543 family)
VSLYAKWTITTYSLGYSLDGGTNSGSNPANYTIITATITLQAPTKTGYTFGGWYTNAGLTTSITQITTGSTGNLILYAKWTAISYSISYTLNSGTNSGSNPATYTVATATIALADPTRTGYTFGGWYTDAGFTVVITQIALGNTGNLSLYAKWTIITYSIGYNLDGSTNSGSNPATYTVATATITLADPSRTGYNFGGWFTNVGLTSSITQITIGSAGNLSLFAKWTITAYSISYNLNSGTNSGSNPATYTVATATITLADPSRTGYTFGGWSPSSSIPLGSTGNKSFTASWTANSYTVTFDSQNGTAPSPASMSVTYGSTYGTLATTTRDGYTFGGWWTGTGGGRLEITSSSGVTITAAQTLYAKWLVNVAFTGLTANGMSGSVTTTVLTLSFDVDPSSLAADDITVSGATKGTLSGTGTTRTLGISAITVVNGPNVTVALASPAGFSITPSSRTVAVYFSLGLTMVSVPAGTFQQPDGVETYTFSVSAFQMSEKEITRAQFAAILGTDPSNPYVSSGTDDPVQQVSWYDAIVFCNKLSLAEGRTPVYSVSGVDFQTLSYSGINTNIDATWDAATANWTNNGYRLPTETEWEWAAMGATSDRWNDYTGTGTNTWGYSKNFAGYWGDKNAVVAYAWCFLSQADKTHPAGTKLPNELGLYDMTGNVWEWIWDWYEVYPTGAVTDYRGAVSGTLRVFRGGSWREDTFTRTIATRYKGLMHNRSVLFGFRVACPQF